MNLRVKCSLLLYIIGLVSCSEKTSEQDIFLDVSDRKKFHIGESGLTSEPFYFVSLDSSRSQGLIFNKVVHSLDSIFFSADSAWVKVGDFLEVEGPYGVGTVFSFFITPDHVIFMNPQQFFNQNRQTGEVSMKFMNEYGIYGDTKYLAVSVPTPSSTHEFYGLDEDSGVGYFVFDNDSEVRIAGFNPSLDSAFFLPVVLNSEKYMNLRFKVKHKGLILGGNDEPQLSVVGDLLIVTFPSFNDILVYDLKSRDQRTYSSTSNSFPSERELPQNYSDEVDSGELQFELDKSWREEVRYGYIIHLESAEKYVRLVKGEGGSDSHFFLEVFDHDFQKTEEFNLSELNPDISSDFLNTKYGLMFRAKDQPDEDAMYYYYLNVGDLK